MKTLYRTCQRCERRKSVYAFKDVTDGKDLPVCYFCAVTMPHEELRELLGLEKEINND